MSWLVYSGMNAGLSYIHAWHLPFGEVMDYAAIKSIMTGTAKQKFREKSFWELMEIK